MYKKGGRYNRYSPEQRVDIGKYTAESGPARDAAHFSQLFGFSSQLYKLIDFF